VANENGLFLSYVRHSGRGEARLCGARINRRDFYEVRVVGASVDISYLALFQVGLAKMFQTKGSVKSLGTIIASEAYRLCHGVST